MNGHRKSLVQCGIPLFHSHSFGDHVQPVCPFCVRWDSAKVGVVLYSFFPRAFASSSDQIQEQFLWLLFSVSGWLITDIRMLWKWWTENFPLIASRKFPFDIIILKVMHIVPSTQPSSKLSLMSPPLLSSLTPTSQTVNYRKAGTVLEMEPQASHTTGKRPTTEPHCPAQMCLFLLLLYSQHLTVNLKQDQWIFNKCLLN